jgi:hypothetical protein
MVQYNTLCLCREPRTLDEALNDKNWRKAMDLEFQALQNNNMKDRKRRPEGGE